MKLNKKGFSLVEILAVIVVLAVIMTAGGMAVFNVIAGQQQALLEEQLNSLRDTAVTYAISKKYILENCGKESEVNPSTLSNSRCFRKVTIQELIDEKFFENKNDLCDTSASVTIYRVNTFGTTYELRAYVPDGVCYY